MDWIRQDKYHFESDCGKYRVSIAHVRERCVYTAWRRVVQDTREVWLVILYTPDLSAAQRACEGSADG